MQIAIVGCTGKLGRVIMKDAFSREDMEVGYAIARKGNQFVGQTVSQLVGGTFDLPILDDIEDAKDCDIFIDCTNAEAFMKDSYFKYEKIGKPLVFIETLKFFVKRISSDTDIQIVEYHHNQKKDAPSGTALMIKDALLEANRKISKEWVNICSIRGGNIFGEHEVIFANCKDETVTFKHQVSSRETFAEGAIEVAAWTAKQKNGLYDMDSFCNRV